MKRFPIWGGKKPLALTTLVRYNINANNQQAMTTLTIRIEEELKKKAAQQAAKLGIPITYVVKSALINFVESPKIVIGEPEEIIVTPNLQEKMNKIGTLLSKK